MKHGSLLAVVALFLIGCGLAYGQQTAENAPVNIGFSFMAGKETFPAGNYTIELKDSDAVVLRGDGKVVVLSIITRLGQRKSTDSNVELVFDKVADKVMLSEVWFPGMDGYLVLTTKEAHEHAVVGGSKPKK